MQVSSINARFGANIEEVDKEFDKTKKDAEAGQAHAQYNLGLCYSRGTRVAVDKRR